VERTYNTAIYEIGAFFPTISDSDVRRSILFPINILMTFGTFSTNSGYHYDNSIRICLYFFNSILETCWLHNRENYENYITLRVTERSKPIIFFLASCIPIYIILNTKINQSPKLISLLSNFN
jgi:hypothetical protein